MIKSYPGEIEVVNLGTLMQKVTFYLDSKFAMGRHWRTEFYPAVVTDWVVGERRTNKKKRKSFYSPFLGTHMEYTNPGGNINDV